MNKTPWIWVNEGREAEINSKYIFENTFQMDEPLVPWTLDITAESRYRLWVNGRWIADGPARSFPEKPFYDRFSDSSIFKKGQNHIRVEVTCWGVDTFQSLASRGGFWIVLCQKEKRILESDDTWRVCRAPTHIMNSPRISCQMGFEEHVNLTCEQGTPLSICIVDFTKKCEPVERGTRLMTVTDRSFSRLVHRASIQSICKSWTFHIHRHLSPFATSINVLGMAGLYGTELKVKETTAVGIHLVGPVHSLHLDGVVLQGALDQDLHTYSIVLEKGSHWLTVAICTHYDHQTELAIGFRCEGEIQFHSPCGDDSSPWVTTGPLWECSRNTNCALDSEGQVQEFSDSFQKNRKEITKKVDLWGGIPNAELFKSFQKDQIGPLSSCFFAEGDAYFSIRTDQEIEGNREKIPLSEKIWEILPESRVILDLEDLCNGYFVIDFEAEGEGVMDGYFFEYLQSNMELRRIQYLQHEGNAHRNSFRIFFKKGCHQFFSAHRRGMRYCILTNRGKETLKVHSVGVREALYGPTQTAIFQSSDPQLDKIFKISQRTLLLCMEDTYTDCPSYEQVLWVGDARNEAIFGHMTFGAYDLSEHCCQIISDSLERVPMAASQCPSGWDVILPAWSFLWVISLSEIYQQTGKKEFLKKMWPSAQKTLDVSLKCCTVQGLFSAPTWNFFDWAPLDQDHRTVLHCSIFLAEALKAGARICSELNDRDRASYYERCREKLIEDLNRLWDEKRGSFPDAICDSGDISQKFSQHTSFLSLLYDLIPDEKRRKQALKNSIEPDSELTEVGSPFAMFFLLELLLKEHQEEKVLEKIHSFWGKIVESDATTCWEMVCPEGSLFPTRSHCHGWSAAPVYLLPMIFFGIEILEPGWNRVRINPCLFGLEFVKTTVCTPKGLMTLEIRKEAGTPVWKIEAPPGVEVEIGVPSPRRASNQKSVS
ncbi:MAG: alpha-L-rhamnosidase C-terminal domain-containing protein [Verrucomicrobiota bacterium]